MLYYLTVAFVCLYIMKYLRVRQIPVIQWAHAVIYIVNNAY